ncbi:hypothetical protein A2U01_0091992, partial [Trifolium medium]|nr:hypothetical protein [Trifolium medium]
WYPVIKVSMAVKIKKLAVTMPIIKLASFVSLVSVTSGGDCSGGDDRRGREGTETTVEGEEG